MSADISEGLDWIVEQVKKSNPVEKLGRVVKMAGLVVESEGPEVSLGDVVEIESDKRGFGVAAEVVGFRDNHVLLMPLGEVQEIHPGCRIVASQKARVFPVGDGLIGRVIDGLGKPLDEKGPLRTGYVDNIYCSPPNPMERGRIKDLFETGIKAIDNFVPMGCGQRLGIFSGSGVGKSSLLGMIARGSEADINVIALVGERGRELKEFIENDLGSEGLAKSVIVVSTSDQAAPLRIRAALLAARISEEFRDKGKKVLLLMDSITRFAMAQREIGLAIGEPPASRGYTPSVFSMLPRLIERSGTSKRGSITALYTVLVEGDDMTEPVTDAVRGTLDGHIVLNRSYATANHYPAIDILESVSRLARQVCTNDHIDIIAQVRDLLAIYRKNEDLINVGAYIKGANGAIDRSISLYNGIMNFLKQPINESVPFKDGFEKLKAILA